MTISPKNSTISSIMTEVIQTTDKKFPRDLPIQVMRTFSQNPMGLHRHAFQEIVIINQGQAVHVIDTERYPVMAGDVFVITHPRAHGYEETRGLVLTNILCHIDQLQVPLKDVRALPGYHMLFTLEPHFRKQHRFESRLRLLPEELSQATALADALDGEIKAQLPGYRLAATLTLLQLIVFLSRCYSQVRQPATEPIRRIGEAISYIEENAFQSIQLEELCTIAHMSKSSLLRAFKKALGMSPIEYLIRLRVSRAADRLRREEASVTEIAFGVGFSDSNYFARQFRKIMGVSPRAYRQRFAGPA